MNMLRQAMQKSYELIEEDTASTSRWLKKHSNHIWAKEGILSFFFFCSYRCCRAEIGHLTEDQTNARQATITIPNTNST